MEPDKRLFFPAIERNKNYIGKVLKSLLPEQGTVLEIGSGSGEHGVIFQKRFPKLLWQTSDPNPMHRASIREWIKYEDLTSKMPIPLDINVNQRPWIISKKILLSLKCIISINMIHAASWDCTESLFGEAKYLLKKKQHLLLYGPFKIKGENISESNFIFDKSLKEENKDWGIRDLLDVKNEAKRNNFILTEIINMPANNHSLIFELEK